MSVIVITAENLSQNNVFVSFYMQIDKVFLPPFDKKCDLKIDMGSKCHTLGGGGSDEKREI